MTKTILASAVGTLSAVALLAIAFRIIGPIPLSISQVTTSKQSSFDVSGEGEVSAVPDRASVSLGISVNEPTVKQAQEKGNSVINAITAKLVSLGIEKSDIKTNNYSLYPNYDYRGGPQKITGYALSVNLEVKIKDFEKINAVVDGATQNGANQVGGVSFTLSDEKRRELEGQVREEAISRAKEKAESLSRLSGVRLGRIIDISENANDGYYPRPYALAEKAISPMAGNDDGRVAAPTQVEPGSTTFRMSVTLSYETL